MILSFFTQKSTRSAKLSSVFAERFSGEQQADFALNIAHKVSLKGRNNLYISCVFNGFKYTSTHKRIQKLANNLEIENLRNGSHIEISELTVALLWIRNILFIQLQTRPDYDE